MVYNNCSTKCWMRHKKIEGFIQLNYAERLVQRLFCKHPLTIREIIIDKKHKLWNLVSTWIYKSCVVTATKLQLRNWKFSNLAEINKIFCMNIFNYPKSFSWRSVFIFLRYGIICSMLFLSFENFITRKTIVLFKFSW